MEDIQVKPCIVRLKNVGREHTKLVKDLPKVSKMNKEQKHLLLPTKKKSAKPATDKTPARGRKKSDGKFQLKISGFLSPPSKKVVEEVLKVKDEDSEDRATPDSGIGNSRSVTPTDSDSRSATPSDNVEKEDDTEDETDEAVEVETEKEKEKFLKELDDSDSESSDDDDDDDWNGSDDDDAFKKKKPAARARKPVAKRGGKMAGLPMIVPGAMKSELSEYEKIRENNIKEREAMLMALMKDFDTYKQDNGLVKSAQRPVKRRKTGEDGAFRTTARAPLTRRKSSRLTEGEKEQEGLIEWSENNKRKLAEEDSDYSDDEEGEEGEKKPRRAQPTRWATDPNVNIIMPEDVTKGMLKRVSTSSTGKVYCQNTGTTCHQCRQKTKDQKTICRSGECAGVRGMFCGRCLLNRYGEDACEALMNPEWKCPPCRGFCNCSICRNRLGKGATGILIHLAQSKGFDNVKDYLFSLTAKKGTDEVDSEPEEE